MDATEDAVLGGRLILRQPRRGHRVGHDAILLAAAVSALAGDQAVDLGAGVGAAGLALARRVEGLAVTLVEIDPALAALCRGECRAQRPCGARALGLPRRDRRGRVIGRGGTGGRGWRRMF